MKPSTRKDKAMKTHAKAVKVTTKYVPRYDPIQERAPDRDVTKAEKKAEEPSLTLRQQIEKQMAENEQWISEHSDDQDGINKRQAANAELTHKLIDLDVAAGKADRTVEKLKG